MILRIHEITGDYAISADVGQQIYDQIYSELLDGHQVTLDFTDVKVFVSVFFNFAIGQLLKDISNDDLNRLLIIEELNSSGKEILTAIIDNAKRYYSDPQYQKAVDDVIDEYAVSFEG